MLTPSLEIYSVSIDGSTSPPSLLCRIAAGDRSAFAECLDRYSRLVWSLARRFLGNSSDAEDAVQDIFVEVWKHAGRFDPQRSSEPVFVSMIARRRLIDYRRKGARRPNSEPLPEWLPTSGSSGNADVERSDEVARAAQLLSELRDDERIVLQLALHAGMTHDEIARETGLPLGTVKTHIRRGLLRVRERLNLPVERGIS